MKQLLRNGFLVLGLIVGSMPPATAQVSIGIATPGVSIGINFPVYPEFVAVPGYPVYYAPRVNSNYFFYDGMYWVYQSDNWYASSWYNGPWIVVVPEAVPLFVLRVPVRYYRVPPPYFHGWTRDAPPRWDEHWGPEWKQRRSGWDRWDRRSVPPRAPLPTYQRQYAGAKYPAVEQQAVLHGQKYKYQPRDAEVRQHYRNQPGHAAAGKSQPRESSAPRSTQQPTATYQEQQAPRPAGPDRGPQGKGSQAQGSQGQGSQSQGSRDQRSQSQGAQDQRSQGQQSQGKGSAQSSGQGQNKGGAKGEHGGGDGKK